MVLRHGDAVLCFIETEFAWWRMPNPGDLRAAMERGFQVLCPDAWPEATASNRQQQQRAFQGQMLACWETHASSSPPSGSVSRRVCARAWVGEEESVCARAWCVWCPAGGRAGSLS